MDFSVDILIPTYQRKKFEGLISLNINKQTYPLIKNVIIADDSNDNLHLDIKYSVLNYNISFSSPNHTFVIFNTKISWYS